MRITSWDFSELRLLWEYVLVPVIYLWAGLRNWFQLDNKPVAVLAFFYFCLAICSKPWLARMIVNAFLGKA